MNNVICYLPTLHLNILAVIPAYTGEVLFDWAKCEDVFPFVRDGIEFGSYKP